MTKLASIARLSVSDTLDNLLKYLFAALLFFIPLYPKFPLFNVETTYVAIRAEDFLIAALGLVLAVKLLDTKLRRSLFNLLITRSILLFWLVGLLSLISAAFLTKTVSPSLGFLHWARRIEYMLPFFAAVYLARKPSNVQFFLKLLLPIALGVFGYGLAQLYLNAPVISTQNEEFSKGFALSLQPGVNLSSTFAGHYDLATYLVMTLALGTALLFAYKHKILKILHLFSLLALFWLQLKTGSRIAFFATTLAVPIVLLLSRRARFIPLVLLIAFLGAVNTPSLSGRFGNLLEVFRFQTIEQKVKGIFDSRVSLSYTAYAAEEPPAPPVNENLPLRPIQIDRSTSIRLDVEWPRAFRALLKNPFLGTGYSSISLATDNDYIRALGEVGLFGFLAWALVLINLISLLLRGLAQKDYRFLSVGVFGLTVGFLIIATFIDVFESSKPATLFWMYTGLAIGVITKKNS